MRHTLFLLGPSDKDVLDASSGQKVEGKGVRMTADLSGVLPILPYVNGEETLRAHSQTILVGLQKIRLRRGMDVNLFNLVGDADASSIVLRQIDDLVQAIKPVRYFNTTDAVHRSARAALPSTLQDIPGCIVPETRAADPATLDELCSACRAFGHWPVIIRSRGHHGAGEMRLLHDESELASLQPAAWMFDGVFLIQFIDCRTEDGLYQKLRIVMIDGVAYARQCVFSDQWSIHAGSRSDLMDDDDELCRRERELLQMLTESGLQKHAPALSAIQQRIGLDVFGIDLALVGDSLVIFEANACMRFLGRDDFSNTRYSYLTPYKQQLRDALKKLLINA